MRWAQNYSSTRRSDLSAWLRRTCQPYLKHAGFQQHLNQSTPMDVSFTDETRTIAPLSHWLGSGPAIMATNAHDVSTVLHGLASSLKELNLKPGKDDHVVTFSIDPENTPADAAGEKAESISRGSRV